MVKFCLLYDTTKLLHDMSIALPLRVIISYNLGYASFKKAVPIFCLEICKELIILAITIVYLTVERLWAIADKLLHTVVRNES